MNIEESVIYIKEKIKNKLPEYTETFVNGKPYRIDVLQLETRWTEKTADAIETLLTAYEKEKEKNRQGKMRIVQLENEITARIEDVNQYYTPNDKIKAIIEEFEKQQKEEPDAYLCIKVLSSLLEKE